MQRFFFLSFVGVLLLIMSPRVLVLVPLVYFNFDRVRTVGHRQGLRHPEPGNCFGSLYAGGFLACGNFDKEKKSRDGRQGLLLPVFVQLILLIFVVLSQTKIASLDLFSFFNFRVVCGINLLLTVSS